MGRPRVRTEELRDQVLEAAIRLVADEGPRALTTRAVASRSGTSLAAVDELFGGKTGLVRAMFVEGFDRLAATLRSLPVARDVESAILDLAAAVRSFTMNHRQLFEVMFSRPYAEFHPEPHDLVGYEETGRIIRSRVNDLFDETTPRSTREDAALTLTAVLHGLVRLELAGTLGSTPASVERRWRTSVIATVRGLALIAAPDIDGTSRS